MDIFDAGISSALLLHVGSAEIWKHCQCSVWLFHFIECDASVSVNINYLFFTEGCCFSSCKNMLVHKLLRYLIGE